MMLTRLTRIREIAHKAETADLMIPTAVGDTHASNSRPTLRAVLALNSLLHLVLVGKIPMPHMEATTIT